MGATVEMASSCGARSSALAYDNPAVIHKFLESHDVSWEEAAELFDEMKKWLWLCAISPQDIRLEVHGSLWIMDEMWHTFILFTREYADFCQRHFGKFIHHAPTKWDIKEARREASERDPQSQRAKAEDSMRRQIEYICEHLGAATAEKWYGTWVDKYGMTADTD